MDRIEVAVEHVDGARAEVGGVEQGARGRAVDGEPLIHRTTRRVVHGEDRHGTPSKSGDGAVLAGEDEAGRGRAAAQNQAGAAVEYDAGRRALLAPCPWNRANRRDGTGTDVVERGAARPVVGNPPRRRWAGNQPPGVDQVRIDDGRWLSAVGDEVGLADS